MMSDKGISANYAEVFLRGFKKEQKLELWAKNKGGSNYTLIKTYDFCTTSGELGPKRRSGDRQIPEGFYDVDYFNPNSQYFLSIRINYPNRSDQILSDPLNPGDGIFIHGECVTIGCIPVGTDSMKEIYILAARAKSHGQTIPVHIFPTKLDQIGYNNLISEYRGNTDLINFWENLKQGHDYFEAYKIVPEVRVNPKGRYVYE
jgi:murein L,D-transpeptidase YafK